VSAWLVPQAEKAIERAGTPPLRQAVKGMPPAAATSRLDAHDIPALYHVAIAERMDDAFIAPTRIDHAASATRGATAGHAPWWMLDAVNAHGDHRLLRQHLKLANEPAAAA